MGQTESLTASCCGLAPRSATDPSLADVPALDRIATSTGGAITASAYNQTDLFVLRDGFPHRAVARWVATASMPASSASPSSRVQIWWLGTVGAAPHSSRAATPSTKAAAAVTAETATALRNADAGAAAEIAATDVAGRVTCVDFLDCDRSDALVGGVDRADGSHDVVVWHAAERSSDSPSSEERVIEIASTVLEGGRHAASIDCVVTTRNAIVTADVGGTIVVWHWTNRARGGLIRLPVPRVQPAAGSPQRRGLMGFVWESSAAAGESSAAPIVTFAQTLLTQTRLTGSPSATPLPQSLACFASGSSSMRRLFAVVRGERGAEVKVWEIPSTKPGEPFAIPELCPFSIRSSSSAFSSSSSSSSSGSSEQEQERDASKKETETENSQGGGSSTVESSSRIVALDVVLTTCPKGGASWFRQLPDASAGESLIGGPPITRPTFLFASGVREVVVEAASEQNSRVEEEHFVIQVWSLLKKRQDAPLSELTPAARVTSLCFGPYDNGPLIAGLANGTVEVWDFLRKRRLRTFALRPGNNSSVVVGGGGGGGDGALGAAGIGGEERASFPSVNAVKRIVVEPSARLWVASGAELLVRCCYAFALSSPPVRSLTTIPHAIHTHTHIHVALFTQGLRIDAPLKTSSKLKAIIS